MHVAAAGYRVEIARLLLASGAEAGSAQYRRNSQPLHYAADGCLENPIWNAKRQVAMIRLLQRFTAIKDFEDQHLMNLAFVLSEHSSKVGLSSKRSNLDAVFAALG